MSAPYHFTPRGPPLVPHSTPLSATAHGFSKPKTSRAPIINPYQKFPQDEFDAWIGGITNALRTALGQEEEQRPASSVAQDQNSLEEHAGSADADVIPQYRTLEQDSENDELPDDSFADIKARRAKGKARDPREGPGLGATGGDRTQPIALDFSDEEEDEIAEGLTMVHDAESEEEQEGEQDEEEQENEESEGSEEDYQWDRGQSSSQKLSTRPVKVGPPRKIQHADEYFSEEVSDDNEETIEEDYDEKYDEEYGEDVEEQDYSRRPPPTTHSSAREVIDILDSDEEEPAQTQQPRSSPQQEGFDDEYDDEEVGEEGHDEEYSEDDEQDKENHSYPIPQPAPPRRSLLADYRARQTREPSYDEDEDEQEGSYDEEEEEGSYQGEDQHQEKFLRPKADIWSPHADVGSDQDVYEGGTPDDWQVESEHAAVSSTRTLPYPPTGDFEVDHDDDKTSKRYTGFPPRPAHFSPPHVDAFAVELPDPWIGPKTYAEDYYASGDVEPVRRMPESMIDPSLLGVEGIYGGDELLEDTASGIGAFLTPDVLTPNESELLSGADEHESITPDAGAEDQLYSEHSQWDDQWQPTQSYPPKIEESNWNTTIVVPPPLRREIPQDAEIIALDDSDDEQGMASGSMEKGEDELEVDEQHDQLREDDDGTALDSTGPPAPVSTFEDIYEENHQVILPPDEPSSGLFERIHNVGARDATGDNALLGSVEALPSSSATPPPNDDPSPIAAQLDNVDEPLVIQPSQSVETSQEVLNILSDSTYAPQPLFARAQGPEETPPQPDKVEEDDLDDIYGSPVPPLFPTQKYDAEKDDPHSDLKESVEVAYDDLGTMNGAASEADINSVSDLPDESNQPETAKTVAEHLSQLGNFGELPTPPWEKVQPSRLESSAQVSEGSEDIAMHKASVEEVSNDEGDADSVPAGSDAIDLDIDLEQSSVDEAPYTILEQGEDNDADGDAEDDVEVISTSSVSEHESHMDENTKSRYFVEEPVTEGRLTEEPTDRALSIDVESIYPERSVTPVGLREAVQGMGEPSKPEIIRPSQGLSKQPSLPEIASEASSSITISPKTDQMTTGRSDVPMPVTADASVPDPTDSPHSPTRPPRNFILSLTGTPKFILSPANSPRPAGNPIPVSVSLPPSILKALRERSAEPGLNVTLHPFPLGFAVQKPDGLFTPAGASTSTVTPTELEEDEARKQALNQIANAIYEPVPDENLTEWPGFDPMAAHTSEEQVVRDEGLNLPPTIITTDVKEVVEEEEQAPNNDLEADKPELQLPNSSLDADTYDEAESATLQPPALLPQAPSVTMHPPIARKPTDPILMSDPYPYSLSTPGASLQVPEEEGSDEDISANLSLSSTSTAEKESDEMPGNEVDGTTSNTQDEFDYEVLAPSGDFEIAADVFEPFQLDAELENTQQHPEVGNDETQFKDFQEILEAEDPFKLMGTDSTVAPGEIKYTNETPPDDLSSHDATPKELQNKSSDAGVVAREATPSLESVPEPNSSRPTQRGAKRKRSSSGKAESSSTRSKGKRGRPKGKAKEQEPSPERPEEDTIHVRPRSAFKNQQSLKRKANDKNLINGQGSSAIRDLSRKDQGSRSSSIVSSVPSDKSLLMQPSPTTNKSFDFHVPDAAHVHYQGLLFHAHGNRRKNPYSQLWTVTQQKEAHTRPAVSKKPTVSQTIEQLITAASPSFLQTEKLVEGEIAQTSTPVEDDENGVREPSSEHPEAVDDHGSTTKHPNHAQPLDFIESECAPATSNTLRIPTTSSSEVSPPFSPAHSNPTSHPSSTARSTRSQCKFRKMSLPREEDGPRVYFIVPGCTLSNLQLLKEEEIEDHGQATSEEGDRMVGHIETLDFNLQLIGIIRQLVGVDIIRENAVYYLPQVGETVRRQSPQKSHGAKAHGMHSSPAISGSQPSSSIRPPISNADSTSTSLSTRRRIIEAEEQSALSSTESDPEESEDDYKPSNKKAKPSPPETHLPPNSQEAATPQPKRGRGRPRKIKVQDMAYKPETDQPEDDSPLEGSSQKSKSTRRGVKRNRTTDVMVEEGEERRPKKLKSHKTAPSAFSPLKGNGQSAAQPSTPAK